VKFKAGLIKSSGPMKKNQSDDKLKDLTVKVALTQSQIEATGRVLKETGAETDMRIRELTAATQALIERIDVLVAAILKILPKESKTS
jgi:hypothetical protein